MGTYKNQLKRGGGVANLFIRQAETFYKFWQCIVFTSRYGGHISVTNSETAARLVNQINHMGFELFS